MLMEILETFFRLTDDFCDSGFHLIQNLVHQLAVFCEPVLLCAVTHWADVSGRRGKKKPCVSSLS